MSEAKADIVLETLKQLVELKYESGEFRDEVATKKLREELWQRAADLTGYIRPAPRWTAARLHDEHGTTLWFQGDLRQGQIVCWLADPEETHFYMVGPAQADGGAWLHELVENEYAEHLAWLRAQRYVPVLPREGRECQCETCQDESSSDGAPCGDCTPEYRLVDKKRLTTRPVSGEDLRRCCLALVCEYLPRVTWKLQQRNPRGEWVQVRPMQVLHELVGDEFDTWWDRILRPNRQLVPRIVDVEFQSWRWEVLGDRAIMTSMTHPGLARGEMRFDTDSGTWTVFENWDTVRRAYAPGLSDQRKENTEMLVQLLNEAREISWR